MPKATTTDISLTKSYIPKVSKIPIISPTIAQFYKSIENRNIHEDFYSQDTVQTDDYGYLVISFIIQHEFITLALAQFRQILKIPYNCQAIFTNEWDLASLEYSQETEGPYCTNLPTPDDIRRLLELERVVVDRTIKSQTATLNPNQIIPKELKPDMKQWEELIRENVIECARATPIANLAYGMFLNRLYRHVMETYPHLDNDIYDIVDRFMRPLALTQTRRPRTSTPSPTTYLNSLDSLNYQNYHIPSSSEQTDETLFTRQTTLLNQMQQMHEEMRGGFKSFGKALKGVFSKKKK
ncbi:hypothetical protein Tco_0331651 [Tanacetum coccineum]